MLLHLGENLWHNAFASCELQIHCLGLCGFIQFACHDWLNFFYNSYNSFENLQRFWKAPEPEHLSIFHSIFDLCGTCGGQISHAENFAPKGT